MPVIRDQQRCLRRPPKMPRRRPARPGIPPGPDPPVATDHLSGLGGKPDDARAGLPDLVQLHRGALLDRRRHAPATTQPRATPGAVEGPVLFSAMGKIAEARLSPHRHPRGLIGGNEWQHTTSRGPLGPSSSRTTPVCRPRETSRVTHADCHPDRVRLGLAGACHRARNAMMPPAPFRRHLDQMNGSSSQARTDQDPGGACVRPSTSGARSCDRRSHTPPHPRAVARSARGPSDSCVGLTSSHRVGERGRATRPRPTP